MISDHRDIDQVIRSAGSSEKAPTVAIARIAADRAVDHVQFASIGNSAAIDESQITAQRTALNDHDAPSCIRYPPTVAARLIGLHGRIKEMNMPGDIVNGSPVLITRGIGKETAGRDGDLAAANKQPTDAAV